MQQRARRLAQPLGIYGNRAGIHRAHRGSVGCRILSAWPAKGSGAEDVPLFAVFQDVPAHAPYHQSLARWEIKVFLQLVPFGMGSFPSAASGWTGYWW